MNARGNCCEQETNKEDGDFRVPDSGSLDNTVGENTQAEASYVSGAPDKLDLEPKRAGRTDGRHLSNLSDLTSSRLTSSVAIHTALTHNHDTGTHFRGFMSSQNDNNPSILKFSTLQESEDRGGHARPRSPSREARQGGFNISLCQRYLKTTQKGVPSIPTLQRST